MTKDLVLITFVHSSQTYKARVYKLGVTAIFLPDDTVMVTNTRVSTNGPRRSPKDQERARIIFAPDGSLIPPSVLHKPGDWDRPLEIHFPIVRAEQI